MLSEEEIRQELKQIEAFVLDQDGTIYLEYKSFPWTGEFLQGLTNRDIDYIFLSNNSSKARQEHIQKLGGYGINVTSDHILSSGDATIEYLLSLPNSRDIYLIATPGVEKDFTDAGFNIDAENPAFVVLAYDLTFTFEKLDKACRYVRNGIPFIATHEDNNWMIAPNDHRPDVGALAAAITTSTKIKPKFIGKPNLEMINAFTRRLGVDKSKIAIVGDRLNTDIRMGYDNDILSFLVLSGKTKADEVADSPYLPSYVIEKTVDILKLLD
jgi:HAD superfamily hydrolase (TIGR01450 family)